MASISDINAETRTLCDADTTSYTAADLLRRINHAYETVIAWILTADGTWQFDDTNFTDLPIGTGTLVEGQESYSFASEYLDIEQVKVKDAAGNWYVLDPLDIPDFRSIAIEEYFPTSGRPEYYDKQGDTIRLYPAPTSTQVTLSGGIKVHFKRTADLFTTAQVSTGTKEPGFASPFHYILSYMAAIPFCLSYKKDRVPLFEKKVQEMKADIIRFYGQREKDARKQMTVKRISFR